ncbi:MAG: DEAD/DEAH box helicase family protein [Planctomycetes bacterium]|nr:DEAD/DEAH box helicase family protein [Planctomycetota bacterium]
MSLEDWQIALRRQFGGEQRFRIKNVGDHAVFSEFLIVNPQGRSSYRVLIRGHEPGDNFCSCGDFLTNSLGTCKHIEFTLSRLRRKPGLKSVLAAGYQPSYSEVFLHYGASREVRFRPGRDCPLDLARLASKYFDSEGALLPEAFTRFEKFLTAAAKFNSDLRCREDVLQFVADRRDRERRHEALDRAFPRGARSVATKNLVKAPLYDYQAEGALFAARDGRCHVGDDMGLGKTIQAIAAAEILARHAGLERVLILCPTSLKHQWQREIERFSDRSVQVIGGLRDRRRELFQIDTFFKILNYDTVHTDLDLIDEWAPDLVILDEAQRIKNWNTRVARSVKRIESPFAFVLTGTPLENRLEELISIVQFVDRFRLGPTFRLLDRHQTHDEHGKVIGYRRLDELGATLKPILIRRLKSNVLDQLPERIDKNFFVPMTPEQARHHEENREIVARIVAKWRRFGFLTEKDQRFLMIALQKMRMSCDSSYLLDQNTNFGVKADELATLLHEIFERPDIKVVIFSQWLRMHEVVLEKIKANRWGHVLFHGGIPGSRRKDLIDRFREDAACRLFLSTDAGGLGLNLQHASTVVNLDLPWNPAVLEQRIGRVHRLGQHRPVQVFNFVAQGTIEHGMLEVLRFKKSLFAGVLDGGETEVFLGGSRLKRFMETVDKTTAAIPSIAPEVFDSGLPESAEAPPSAVQPPALVPFKHIGPLAGLLEQGVKWLRQLQGPPSPGSRVKSGNSLALPSGLVATDERTGESYLRLPLPTPDVLEKAVAAIVGLLQPPKT